MEAAAIMSSVQEFNHVRISRPPIAGPIAVSTSLFAAEADDAKKLNGVWKGWVVEGAANRKGNAASRLK